MKPILKKLLDTVAWWGPYSPLTGFAYNFKTGQYMSRGQQIALGTAVTEGRSTDAYVLSGDNYVLRSANEPAQANGHGLDGFEETVNLVTNSEDLSNAAWANGSNMTTSLEAISNPANLTNVTKIEAISTSGFAYVRQGETVTADDHTVTIVAKKGNYRYLGIRAFILGVGQSHASFDFDTKTFVFVPAEVSSTRIKELNDGWFELSVTGTDGGGGFRFAGVALSNVNGSETPTLAAGNHAFVMWADAVESSFQTPHFDGTRDADDTRLVQGDDGGTPTIAPGISANPEELTFRVDWDGVAVGTGTDRVLFQVKNASNRYVSLLIDSSDDLRWGGDQTGSFQSLDAGGTFDDGGAHTAVCYFNRTTSELKLSVDGAAPITGTLTGAVPSNLDEMAIGRTATGTSNSANGTNCRIQASDGDFFEAFRDSSAGFF